MTGSVGSIGIFIGCGVRLPNLEHLTPQFRMHSASLEVANAKGPFDMPIFFFPLESGTHHFFS
jgi:hypothetical protein